MCIKERENRCVNHWEKRTALTLCTAMGGGSKVGNRVRSLMRKHRNGAATVLPVLLVLLTALGCGMLEPAGMVETAPVRESDTALMTIAPKTTVPGTGTGEETETAETYTPPLPTNSGRRVTWQPEGEFLASGDPRELEYPRMDFHDPVNGEIYVAINPSLYQRLTNALDTLPILSEDPNREYASFLMMRIDNDRELCQFVWDGERWLLGDRRSFPMRWHVPDDGLTAELLGMVEYVSGWDIQRDLDDVKDLVRVELARGDQLKFSSEDRELCRRVEECLHSGLIPVGSSVMTRNAANALLQLYLTGRDGTVTACAVDLQEGVLWCAPWSCYYIRTYDREAERYRCELLSLLGMAGYVTDWSGKAEDMDAYRSLYLRWQEALRIGESHYHRLEEPSFVFYANGIKEMPDYPPLVKVSEFPASELDYPRMVTRPSPEGELWYVSMTKEQYVSTMELLANEPGESPEANLEILLRFILPDEACVNSCVVRRGNGALAIFLDGKVVDAPDLAAQLISRAETVSGFDSDSWGSIELTAAVVTSVEDVPIEEWVEPEEEMAWGIPLPGEGVYASNVQPTEERRDRQIAILDEYLKTCFGLDPKDLSEEQQRILEKSDLRWQGGECLALRSNLWRMGLVETAEARLTLQEVKRLLRGMPAIDDIDEWKWEVVKRLNTVALAPDAMNMLGENGDPWFVYALAGQDGACITVSRGEVRYFEQMLDSVQDPGEVMASCVGATRVGEDPRP